MTEKAKTEPWLRGTREKLDPVRRAVLHALDMTGEDAARWCSGLTEDEMEMTPFGNASVGFHLRHMARSLDRLLTYAEGGTLTEGQKVLLETEMVKESRERTLLEFAEGLEVATKRIERMRPESYGEPRGVGRKALATTVGGLLIHCAEHTQRHSGQMVTTAKVVAGLRSLREG